MMGQENGSGTGFLPDLFQGSIPELPGRLLQGKPFPFRQGPDIHIHPPEGQAPVPAVLFRLPGILFRFLPPEMVLDMNCQHIHPVFFSLGGHHISEAQGIRSAA